MPRPSTPHSTGAYPKHQQRLMQGGFSRGGKAAANKRSRRSRRGRRS